MLPSEHVNKRHTWTHTARFTYQLQSLDLKQVRYNNEPNAVLMLLTPNIITYNSILLLGGQVVLDIEARSNLIRRLAIHFIRNCLTLRYEREQSVE